MLSLVLRLSVLLLLVACDKAEDAGTVSGNSGTSNMESQVHASPTMNPSTVDISDMNEMGAQSIDSTNQFIPAYPQRPGDPVAGKQALITQPIVSCGLPMQAVEQLDIASAYRLSNRQAAAADLPYNLNLIEDDNGVQLAASNCLTCHAAPLFGELIIGLGNEFLDFTVDASQAVERAGALVSGEHEIAAWEKYADRVAAIAPYMQLQTAGVNPANNLTFALMAHRDAATMAWYEEPQLVLPTENVPPVSVPPWWRMKKKHALFWMGEGRGDHAAIMMTAAIMCSDTLEEVQQLDAIAPDVRAFIDSIEPPTYPFDTDLALATAGKTIFENSCSQCHGTYGEEPSYPNRLVGIEIVGTDPTLINYAFGEGQAYVEWFNKSPFAALAQAQPSPGYVAPPLDGVWATGPFLHNGSVPSIRAVLDSRTRPVLWHHRTTNSESADSFNQADLGWIHTSVAVDADLSDLEVAPQWLYDTRRAGYSNSGHQFGDGLSSEQRDAVIEYLKTL